MGSTYTEDQNHYAKVMRDFAEVTMGQALGDVQFAGTHWARAHTTHGSRVDQHVAEAFEQAAALLNAGYLKATAAIRNRDEEASMLMVKWFGRRHTHSGPSPENESFGMDTWLAAKRIIGHLQTRLSVRLHLYYRGEDSLIGQPNDYPGHSGNLDADDVRGYAESSAGVTDGVVGLCKQFFKKGGKGDFSMKLKGFDSVGGTLVHELSHNYCGTEDHEGTDGQTCYGTRGCLRLARKLKTRAWYNADNIEYFCEEAAYGIVAAKVTIQTGTGNPVANLRAAQDRLIKAVTESKARPGTQAVTRGPSDKATQMKAFFTLKAVASNPTLAPVDTGATGSKVSDLRKLWR